jgi:spermidine synthase
MKIVNILLIGFALSNMSALIYEVAWSRELTYVFGTSVYAISTILTCFMTGLGIGSFWIGRLADKSKNPLRLFALLELGIGIYGILVIWIFSLLVHPYQFLHSMFYGTFLFVFSQFVLAFATLIIPTTFIGATFPIMSKIYTKKYTLLGEKVGVVYSLDTVGAAIGSFSSGFLLIPILGLSKTIIFAALINLAVSWAIYNLSTDTVLRIKKTNPRVKGPMDRLIIACFFFSGFAALMYEVIWTRSLSLVFGTTTFAFSTMLSTFMIGLALGSYAISRVVDRVKDLVSIFVYVELGIAFCGVLSLFLFSNLDMLYFTIYSKWNASFSAMWFIFFLIFFLLLLAPTMLMGMTMPIVSRIYSSSMQSVGKDIGVVFSSNTFGGIFGSFAAGFILLPVIGVEKATVIAALMNIGVATAMFGHSKIKKIVFLPVLGIFLVICGVLTIQALEPLQIGVYYHAPAFESIDDYRKFKAETRLLFKKDDPNGLVTVTKIGDLVSLRINGKVEANNFGDIPHQYMVALVPLITHKEPKSVLNIGLGAGFTLSVIEDFDVDKIDSIEINPAVVDATEKYFSEYNNNALKDPRVNLIIADARNYLFTSNKRYDVIISEPSNIWISQSGGLFTREFYDVVKEHLNDGGIFCQWVSLFDQKAEDFKIFLNTFHSVFPYVQVYKVRGSAILIGSEEEMHLEYPRLVEKFNSERVKDHFAKLRYVRYVKDGIMDRNLPDVEYFLSFYHMNSEEVRDYVGGVEEKNTDDMPILEFNTAKNLLLKEIPVEERPVVDIIHFKIGRYGRFLVEPPIKNAVEVIGNKHAIDLAMVSVENIDEWRLKEVRYGFSYLDLVQFDILRSVEYSTPMGSLVVYVIDNIYGTLEEKQIREFMAYYWKIVNLKTIGEMEIEGHNAYLFTDNTLVFCAWHCEENAAVYLLILPYTDNIANAKEIFQHVKCTYKHVHRNA